MEPRTTLLALLCLLKLKSDDIAKRKQSLYFDNVVKIIFSEGLSLWCIAILWLWRKGWKKFRMVRLKQWLRCSWDNFGVRQNGFRTFPTSADDYFCVQSHDENDILFKLSIPARSAVNETSVEKADDAVGVSIDVWQVGLRSHSWRRQCDYYSHHTPQLLLICLIWLNLRFLANLVSGPESAASVS